MPRPILIELIFLRLFLVYKSSSHDDSGGQLLAESQSRVIPGLSFQNFVGPFSKFHTVFLEHHLFQYIETCLC